MHKSHFCIFPVYRTVTQFAIVVSKAFFGDKKDPWVLFSFLLERGTVVLMYLYIYINFFGKKIVFSFFIYFVCIFGGKKLMVFFLVL